MSEVITCPIESVDLDAQGLARHDGKVIFVENALLGEVVDVEITRSKASYAKGRAVAWHKESSQRVVPRCRHYGVCGGCAMQHIDSAAQIAIKQRVLEDNLWHIGRLKADQMLPPLDGSPWGYRTRARLTARWVDKKGGMLLGFHERKSSYVAVMNSCEILHPRVSEMLPAMRELLGTLSIAKRLPQAEVAVGEPPASATGDYSAARVDPVIAWVLRILEPLTAEDEAQLRAFADTWSVQFWLQPGGPTTAALFYPPNAQALAYYLPEFNLHMPFSPVDFTQVNPGINQVMVKRAIDLLDPQPADRVADYFCGLGNFTLALARRSSSVAGFEGSASLTDRAMRNAELHHLENRVSFSTCNLFDVTADWLTTAGAFDRVLLDPPREGAQALCQAMADLHQADPSAAACVLPRRMVYVSCNPSTLARDAAILVHQGGWVLQQAGVINMFPHTAHVESIAMFERPK
jgi:23S rRNA (uracil1939-C5)-methyltransferase